MPEETTEARWTDALPAMTLSDLGILMRKIGSRIEKLRTTVAKKQKALAVLEDDARLVSAEYAKRAGGTSGA